MLIIKEIDEKFESIEEFSENIARGGEVEFVYNNKKFSITRQNNNIYLIEIGNNQSEREFSDINQLLDYKIDNCIFRDIVTLIEPYFRCF